MVLSLVFLSLSNQECWKWKKCVCVDVYENRRRGTTSQCRCVHVSAAVFNQAQQSTTPARKAMEKSAYVSMNQYRGGTDNRDSNQGNEPFTRPLYLLCYCRCRRCLARRCCRYGSISLSFFLPRCNKHTLTHSLTAVAGGPHSVSPTLLPPPVLAVVVGLVVDDGCTSRTHKIRIQRLPLELFAQIEYSSRRKTVELLLSESIGELVLMIADIWCVMVTSCAGSFRRDVASFGSFHATFSHM